MNRTKKIFVVCLVASLFVGLIPFARAVECITNGGFEDTENSWSAVGWEALGTLTISTIEYHSGEQSAELTYSSSIWQNMSVPIDEIESFTFWIKKESGNGITYMFFVTSNDGYVSFAMDYEFEGYDWQEINVLGIINGDGDTGILQSFGFLRMDDNFVNYYFDDVTLNGPASPTPTPTVAPTSTVAPTPTFSYTTLITWALWLCTAGGFLTLFIVLIFVTKNRRDRGSK